jgi:hypothetical protein
MWFPLRLVSVTKNMVNATFYNINMELLRGSARPVSNRQGSG